MPRENYVGILEKIDFLNSELENLELTSSLASARELKKILNEEVETKSREEMIKLGAHPQGTELSEEWFYMGQLVLSRYQHYAADLVSRFRDELSARVVLAVSPRLAKYYDPATPIFGTAVADKFPNQVGDMFEAGNCYALGRYTACVFHLMRLMEVAVQAFGSKLGVTLATDLNWQKILALRVF